MNKPYKPLNVTKEEQQLIKDSLVIPVMLDYIDNDITTIQKSGLNTDLILINGLKKVQNDILSEHFGIRLRLKKSGIKVYDIRRTTSGIDAEYLCRGYVHKMNLLWGTVRSEVLYKASQYTGIKLAGD